jgi:hypothetical protein
MIKLTPEQERQIRHSYEYEGATQVGLARRFGVSNKVIRRVLGLPNNRHREATKLALYCKLVHKPKQKHGKTSWLAGTRYRRGLCHGIKNCLVIHCQGGQH